MNKMQYQKLFNRFVEQLKNKMACINFRAHIEDNDVSSDAYKEINDIIDEKLKNYLDNLGFYLCEYDIHQKDNGYIHDITGFYFEKLNDNYTVIKKFVNDKEEKLNENDITLCKANNWQYKL